MGAWTWPDATCFNVVDGDTIDLQLNLDVGFGARTTHRVRGRLNRIDAPKVSTDAGKAAREFLYVHAHSGTPPLTVVTVEPYKFGGPKWSPGQWMVEVTLPDGSNLSDVLVEAGHAVYWDGSGPRPNLRDVPGE